MNWLKESEGRPNIKPASNKYSEAVKKRSEDEAVE
jgi:hypothetical protein